MTRVSVVIPAYNAEKTIRECVGSVLDNDYDDFEVIVVEDNSIDGTKKILESITDGRIKLFFNKTNSGASFSRNEGIKRSLGDVVLLLDSDSYVGEDWIRRHVKLHEEVFADIIGGGIVGVHTTVFGESDTFCTWWTSIPYSKDHYLKKLHIPTNNMSIKKEVFQKMGYFDERFKVGGEDAEFCFRALKNGLAIYFKSDVIAYHYDRDSLTEFLKHQGNWTKEAIRIRRESGMDYAHLMPNSYIMAWLAILPLSILYTAFIVSRWLRYNPSVMLYTPAIFLGQLNRVSALKRFLKDK